MPIRITSKQHHFRRCGVAHPKSATEYPDGRFTDAELDILDNEPMLMVQRFQASDDGPGLAVREPGSGSITETGPLESLTVPKLQKLLDKLKIAYPAAAKRQDLVDLVLANTSPPPATEE